MKKKDKPFFGAIFSWMNILEVRNMMLECGLGTFPVFGNGMFSAVRLHH